MKLLKIKVKGLELFKEEMVIDFYAEQRVSSENNEMVSNIFGNTYTNNTISFIGINASGKTTILKVVSFVIKMLNNEPINSNSQKDVLNHSRNVLVETYFYDENKGICKLYTNIELSENKHLEERYIISEEKLWTKKETKIYSKKSLFEFDDTDIFYIRSNEEEFLKDDMSIIITLTKNSLFNMIDLIGLTNINLIKLAGDFPHELFEFLDPSIEDVTYDKRTNKMKLKFYGKKGISITSPLELNNYLSSGTIKGINVFVSAMMVFQNGGYLIVDEIENHFNREIVATLIRFFMNKKVNKTGATIIFSTHYAELLDEFERNDGIYIVRNREGITVEKLSYILKRNDIKKSEAYQSDFLQGTVPTYKAYLGLKNAMIHGEIKEV